jgi:hypothetical protein
MNKSTRLVITAAALTGLYAGSLATRAYAADEKAGTTDSSKQAPKDKASCNGKNGCNANKDAKANCSGKAGCNGKGDKASCKADANAKTDKASCNGKAGCNAKPADEKKG